MSSPSSVSEQDGAAVGVVEQDGGAVAAVIGLATLGLPLAIGSPPFEGGGLERVVIVGEQAGALNTDTVGHGHAQFLGLPRPGKRLSPRLEGEGPRFETAPTRLITTRE